MTDGCIGNDQRHMAVNIFGQPYGHQKQTRLFLCANLHGTGKQFVHREMSRCLYHVTFPDLCWENKARPS
ncbi:hypothetical protein DPMN_165020 [Dreissena polymorpha]|uniref:Uncharacterized protein n=1 Tax=Dreissena polymorpha TaxID=45954 RepID=A0A9D4IU83_DREPO|nr:hypothetical protein DPMN_165020 [Dreissena polymorpha]